MPPKQQAARSSRAEDDLLLSDEYKTMTNSSMAAESIAIEIAERMVNPEAIKALAQDPTNVNPRPISKHFPVWNDSSFAGGYPGLLLMFATMQKRNVLKNEGAPHQYVLKIKESMEREGLFDLSLYGGLAGICFALQEASLEGTRYLRMLNTLQSLLIDQVNERYLVPMKNCRDQNEWTMSNLYDPISGISGIGRYALMNLSQPQFQKLAEDITSTLVQYSQPLHINDSQVPGWYLSPKDSINMSNPNSDPKGNFNLGLAHGVTGVLSYLASAYLKGVKVEGHKDSIRHIANWIRDKSFMHDHTINWPYSISWDEEIGKEKKAKETSRDAWCYGVPGIARTLFLAGKALDDEDLKNFAGTAFKGIFLRKREKWNIPGPGLCHGIAGLLAITSEMAKEKGCEDLLSKVEELQQILIASYRPESPIGFKDVEPCLDGGHAEVSKPGFLEGTAGVVLALFSSSVPNSQWHLPLLIS